MHNPYQSPQTIHCSDTKGALILDLPLEARKRAFWLTVGLFFLFSTTPLCLFLLQGLPYDMGIFTIIGGVGLMIVSLSVAAVMQYCLRIRIFENGIELTNGVRRFHHWDSIAYVNVSGGLILGLKNVKLVRHPQSLSKANETLVTEAARARLEE